MWVDKSFSLLFEMFDLAVQLQLFRFEIEQPLLCLANEIIYSFDFVHSVSWRADVR